MARKIDFPMIPLTVSYDKGREFEIERLQEEGEEGEPIPPSGKEIAIQEDVIDVCFDYPLEVEHVQHFSSKSPGSGFSYEEIFDLIVSHYKEIYNNPDEYRPWGHGFGDLALDDLTLGKDGVWKISMSS